MNQLVILALIQALQKEVGLLELQLSQQAVVATSVSPTIPVQLGVSEPVQTVQTPVVTPDPTCTLQVTPDVDNSRSAVVQWTSSNTTNNVGQITFGEYFGCGDSCSNYKMVSPPTGGKLQGSSGNQDMVFNTDFNYPNNSLNHDNNTKVELTIGGATCDDYVPAK